MSSSPPTQPQITDVTIDRPNGVIQLAFEGGPEGSIGLRELRLGCPCANCRRARQAGRDTWVPRNGEEFPSVRDAEFVGAWGLSIAWDDGHATGIYPFSSLAEWISKGRRSANPDSGLPG